MNLRNRLERLEASATAPASNVAELIRERVRDLGVPPADPFDIGAQVLMDAVLAGIRK